MRKDGLEKEQLLGAVFSFQLGKKAAGICMIYKAGYVRIILSQRMRAI